MYDLYILSCFSLCFYLCLSVYFSKLFMYKNFIFPFIITLFLSFCSYFAINSFGTFAIKNYAVAEVQHQRNIDNKILLSVAVDGEQFLLSVYVKDAEKKYFQFEKQEKIVFKKYETTDRKPEYTYIGKYILPYVISVLIFFIGLLFIFFGRAVFRPLATLFVGILFISSFLFPSLLNGDNIYLFGFGSITLLVVFSILFTHGFSRAAYISALSSAIVLIFAYALGEGIVRFFNLFGIAGSNISYFTDLYPHINLQGIFLIGIFLGIVGVIDDVTMAQSTAAEEIYEANPNYSQHQLYSAGMVLGKAHIFSMLNTLIFAYIGTSIPVYLYTMSLEYPFWVLMNSTLFAEEFLRVLVALFALTLAIPLTAFFSAVWITHSKK